MATLTRTQLRVAIGKRLSQPYFRKFGGSGTASTNGTTTTLIDTAKLKEEDNYWRGQFIYLPATDELREISAFTNSSSTVTWLAAVAGTASTASGVAYEIWSQFTPHQVHDAINHALLRAWPAFFSTTMDERLVIKDGKGLKYTLPTTNVIRRLCQIYLMIYQSVTGTITTLGTATQVIDSAASFTSADVGKYVAAYRACGTATGEIKQVSAVVSGTELTVGAFSAALSLSGSYRLLNKEDTTPAQLPVVNAITDAPEFPTLLWFGQHLAGYEGFPIQLMYEYEYPKLTAEASTTTCPEEFVYAVAMSYIYMLKLATAPAVEQPAWDAMFKTTTALAELYARTHKFSHLSVMRVDHNAMVSSIPADYPFRE